MSTILRLEGDPTLWYIQGNSPTLSELTGSGRVLPVPVDHPVRGTLLLSAGAFSSFAVTVPPMEGMPSDIDVPTAQIYLPTATGITPDNSGYPLSVNPGEAASQILNAMTTGEVISIAVHFGQVFLNGARIPFVVMCEPSAG